MVKKWVEACVVVYRAIYGMVCLLLIAHLPPLFYRQIRKVVFVEPVGQVEEMNEGKTTYLDLTAFSFHIMKKVTASL